jgi:PadR family transcriptional regulator, regulatory protein PadR
MRIEIPPGTLYMLILTSLVRLGPMHGYGIALHIQQTTDDVLQVEEGTLYPALQRMLIKGWVKAEWRVTENKRRARYYSLTPAGRKQVVAEVHQFDTVMAAVRRVIAPAMGRG